jgi:F-type H+-transporting ATPase subunit b
LDKLGIDVGVLVAQLINFFLLLGLLSLVLYIPVTRMLGERSERIAKGLADADLAAKRAAQAEADYQKHLDEARREAQAIIAEAHETAEKERQTILSQAQAEAQEMRHRAEEEVQREQRAALADLQNQVADLAIGAAGQVLGHAVDEPDHRQLIHDFLSHLEKAS